MTQTMLERAARAAFESHAWGYVGPDESPHAWGNLPEVWRDVYDKMARDVLMAVREPDVGICIDANCGDDKHPADSFTAMIDAILNEPQP